MHSVSGSRVMMYETKNPEELKEFLAEHLARHQAMTEIEHPTRQLRLVIEWHSQTGFWMVYCETVLKSDFGGEISQEQTLDHLRAAREVSLKHAQECGL